MIPVRVADKYRLTPREWVLGDGTSLPHDWLCKHTQKYQDGRATWWHDSFETFYFENQEDAVLFALYWS